MPRTGIEPVRCCHRRILSPVRLPVPPPRLLKRTTGFEPATPTLARWCSTTELRSQSLQCRLHDLNTRPSDYKSDALPTELSRPISIQCGLRDLNPHARKRQILNLVRLPIPPNPHMTRAGLEPATHWLKVNCSTNWANESYIFLWIVPQTIRTVPTGIEPAIFAVTGRRDNRYTTGPICTQAKILVKKINFLESLTLCQFPIFIRIY